MEWLKWLGDLSPAALLVVAIWVIAVKIITPMLGSHKDIVERLTKEQKDASETMRKGLDANTEAVKESVKHNETIISNHLGKQAKRDVALILEMRNVATSIEIMNNRHRKDDLTLE